MAILTDRLAPRIIINENDIPSQNSRQKNPPVTLVFGFAPIGKTMEMVVCNNTLDVYQEFGTPESLPEKYFIDAGIRVVQNGATALMTRLPYDNSQCNIFKYVEYRIENPISVSDLITGPMEDNMRNIDNNGVTILKQLHGIDKSMTQFQRIRQIKNEDGLIIKSMSSQEITNIELDPISNLEKNSFILVDIRGEKYGTGQDKINYTGIFPIVITSPMGMLWQRTHKNIVELSDCLQMIDIDHGIEFNSKWFTNHISDKSFQNKILSSIVQKINYSSKQQGFRELGTFQGQCSSKFPRMGMARADKIDKGHLKDIMILVCRIAWDSDSQTTTLQIIEQFQGPISGKNSIDRSINSQSKHIRMYKNLSVDNSTDFFVNDNQKITSLGMDEQECIKRINYKKSIIEPIIHMLESTYSDIDSLHIDTILDAGLSSTAFAAYVNKNIHGKNFKDDENTTVVVNWSKSSYNIDDYIDDYAKVWNEITSTFGNFCQEIRGDCVYLADGPRILNLDRNYPINNYIDIGNQELLTKYLPLFNGSITSNYVSRYFNWVFIEDMQYISKGIWVPGSVVMGGQLSFNDKNGQVWYAPAGQERGLIQGAFDTSIKTKQYNMENDILYSNNWNFFQIYQNEGVVVEGQKTLQTKKTSLDRLNVRRMVCWIKQQARIIGNKYKYEPHTKSNREGFKQDIVSMLETIKRTSGISDYAVLCDQTNNTIETIDRHELWCKIGIKPIKAIEYIIIDLNIINGNVNING